MDRELRFGFLKNGSLVVARSVEDETSLAELLTRGKTNGVKNLRIIKQVCKYHKNRTPNIKNIRFYFHKKNVFVIKQVCKYHKNRKFPGLLT